MQVVTEETVLEALNRAVTERGAGQVARDIGISSVALWQMRTRRIGVSDRVARHFGFGKRRVAEFFRAAE